MKKIFDSQLTRIMAALLLGLLCWKAAAGQAATITVSNLRPNSAYDRFSFTVSWTGAAGTEQFRVLMDYLKVDGVTTTGSWSPATVTGATVTAGSATAALVADYRGFELNINAANGSATVTTALQVPSDVKKFQWCVNAFGMMPTLETTDPAPRCGAGDVTLSATASGGTTSVMSYAWIVGGVAQTSTSNNTYTATVGTGSTTYSVTVTNSAGIASDAATGTITAYELPAAPTSPTTNAVCNEGNVTFGASVPGDIIIDWYANAAGGSAESDGSGTASISRYLTSSATFYAEARNTTTACVSASRLPVAGKVNALPTVPSLSANTAAACAGSAITFTANSGSGTYDWTSTGFTCSGNGATQTTPATAGTYKAEVRSAKTENGITCYSDYSTEQTVYVNALPYNLSLSSSIICPGQSATLTATANNAASYSLTGNVSDWQTASTFEVNPASTQNYTLHAMSAAGCTATVADAGNVTVGYTPAGTTVTVENFCPDPGAATATSWYIADLRETNNPQTYTVQKMTDEYIWFNQTLRFGNKCTSSSASIGSLDADHTDLVSTTGTYYGNCYKRTDQYYYYNWAAAVNKPNA